MQRIRTVIADDHQLFTDGLVTIFQQTDFIEVLSCLSNGEELIAFMKQNAADLVILDVSMPRVNGMEAAEYIKQHHPSTRILIVTMSDSVEIVRSLMNTGVDGILLKNSSKTEFLLAVSEVCKGEGYFSQKITQQLARGYQINNQDQWQLTKREKEVLQLIYEGLTTSQIAEKLFISNYTVETHKKNLFIKSGVNKSSLLIKQAQDLGYIKRDL